MLKLDRLGQTFAAIVCTLAFSTTMIASAVAPAQAGNPVAVTRTVA